MLLLQADAREIDNLVRALGSDAPEERDDAIARLKRIGPPAVPALETAAKSTDADIRGHASRLLEEIARAERVKGLRPSERRITIELRDAPLVGAVRKTLYPFGYTEAKVDPLLAGRDVSLSLKEASFWEAVEELEKRSGGRFNLSNGVLHEAHPGDISRAGTGPVRLTAHRWGSRSAGGASKSTLYLQAWSSPGAWACSAELEKVEVIGEGGVAIACEVVPGLEGKRHDGLPSESGVGLLAFSHDDLQGVKSLTVRGVLTLGFPRDAEVRKATLDPSPAVVKWESAKVGVEELKKEGGSWRVRLDGSAGDEGLTVLMSIEDAEGRWLGDLDTWRLYRRVSIGTSGTGWTLKEGVPSRFVVLRAKGEDTVKLPFLLTGIKPD